MPYGLLGVFRHQALELGLRILVFDKGRPGPAMHAGKLGPGIGRAHVDDPHRLDAGARWVDAEEARGLVALHAAPEFLFRGQEEVLVKGIG